MTDFQTPEELEAHYGPGGPAAVAVAWLGFLLNGDGDLAQAWELMDEPLRLALAQDRIIGSAEHPGVKVRDRDELAGALSRGDTSDPMWDAFAASVLAEYRDAYADLAKGVGIASRPRPVGPDLEIVLAILTDTAQTFTGPTVVEGVPILLRLTVGGWKVANHGGEPFAPPTSPPEPGWPPRGLN